MELHTQLLVNFYMAVVQFYYISTENFNANEGFKSNHITLDDGKQNYKSITESNFT